MTDRFTFKLSERECSLLLDALDVAASQDAVKREQYEILGDQIEGRIQW